MFDLTNLKQGDKSKLETIKPNQGSFDPLGPNLLSSNEDLDKLWNNPMGQGSQGMSGMQGTKINTSNMQFNSNSQSFNPMMN